MAGSNLSCGTRTRGVSAIAYFHRAGGQPNPCDAMVVKLALKRMHRERGRAQQLMRRGELVDLQFSNLTVESDGFGTVLIRRGR